MARVSENLFSGAREEKESVILFEKRKPSGEERKNLDSNGKLRGGGSGKLNSKKDSSCR